MESRFAHLRQRDTSVSMMRVKMSRRRSQTLKENRERTVNSRRQLDNLPELELSSMDASIAMTNMSVVQEKTVNNAKPAKSEALPLPSRTQTHSKFFWYRWPEWSFIFCHEWDCKLFSHRCGCRWKTAAAGALERAKSSWKGERKEREGAERCFQDWRVSSKEHDRCFPAFSTSCIKQSERGEDEGLLETIAYNSVFWKFLRLIRNVFWFVF